MNKNASKYKIPYRQLQRKKAPYYRLQSFLWIDVHLSSVPSAKFLPSCSNSSEKTCNTKEHGTKRKIWDPGVAGRIIRVDHSDRVHTSWYARLSPVVRGFVVWASFGESGSTQPPTANLIWSRATHASIFMGKLDDPIRHRDDAWHRQSLILFSERSTTGLCRLFVVFELLSQIFRRFWR